MVEGGAGMLVDAWVVGHSMDAIYYRVGNVDTELVIN